MTESTRRDLESTVQQSERLVRALLESVSQAIIGIDLEGEIVLVNNRAQEMFGYTREELLGSSLELLLPEARRTAHQRQRSSYFDQPHTRPMGIGMDLAGSRKNGSEFPVEVSLSFVESPEGVFGIAFVTDISQRKTLEQQLMHAQKMEAVGRLAGGVAHDFNNMLTVISGYSRMILDDLPAGSELRGYLEETLKAADRAASITSQLLAFSRRQVMQAAVVDVNHIISRAEKMLRRLIGEDIELELSLANALDPIRADPNYLEQAIVNLAVNARDAMPAGGRLRIHTTAIALDESFTRTHPALRPGPFLRIDVSDTGHGMDATTVAHIFEPFFTTKERGKGTGLGLATVYGMVQQTGGDVQVTSQPGHGSTFHLYFPTVVESLSATPEQPSAGAGAGFETVLVVEDEAAVREFTAKVLRQLGYQVLTASGGDEAIRVSDAHSAGIAALITDVIMPGMSGRQVADELKRRRTGIKVLFVSGYTEDMIADHGMLEAGVDFLAKPFHLEDLARKLREVLDRR
ncbi:MAG: PAS domain S-box protein [Bryobacteraceae bacterium]|jgi:PAS domain S-box-containing protein